MRVRTNCIPDTVHRLRLVRSCPTKLTPIMPGLHVADISVQSTRCLLLLCFITLLVTGLGSRAEEHGEECPPSKIVISSYECHKWDGTIGRCMKKTCCAGYQFADGRCVSEERDACDDAPCEQQCQDDFGRAHCTCYPGYEMNKEKYLVREHPYCEDLNECSTDNGGCLHICNNTAGSFHCSCRHGYRLDADGRSCLPNEGANSTDRKRDTGSTEDGRCQTSCSQLQSFKDSILKVQSKIIILESRMPQPPTLSSDILLNYNGNHHVPLQPTSQWAKGEKGEPGTGLPGPRGLQGLPGRPGPKGDQGRRGVPGTHGPPGLTGAPGPRGQPGATGYKGNRGTIGPMGSVGHPGSTGMRGYTGPTGMQGPKGEKGSCVVMSLSRTRGVVGLGPKGEKGETGEPGPMGLMGSRGLTGQKGSLGPAGPPGPPGLPTSGDANLTVDELSHQWKTGSKGDTGHRGEQGLPGIKGDKGDSGSSELLLLIIAEMKKDIIKLQKRLFRADHVIVSATNNNNDDGNNNNARQYGSNTAGDVIGPTDRELSFTSSSYVDEGSGH